MSLCNAMPCHPPAGLNGPWCYMVIHNCVTGMEFRQNMLLASRTSEANNLLVLLQIYWPGGLVAFKFYRPTVCLEPRVKLTNRANKLSKKSHTNNLVNRRRPSDNQ